MDARVKVAIDIVERSMAKKLSIRALCRSVNLSPARLRQLFRLETGLSPMQYVKRVRLERAANLLRTTFLSVKEVTYQSGATDIRDFIRDFKKKYGLTPSEYRTRRRLSQAE
jgi:transcriptional regulator GlxA family with amidase domain